MLAIAAAIVFGIWLLLDLFDTNLGAPDLFNFPTMASLVPQSTSSRYHEFAFQIEDDVRVEPSTIVELALSSMSSWLVAGETTNESVRAELDAKPK